MYFFHLNVLLFFRASPNQAAASPFRGVQPVHLQIVVDCELPMKNGEVDILNHLGQLLYSGTDSDVNFIVKEKKMTGHKLIIRGGSPVLAAMFEHDMIEKSSGAIEINDIEPNVFRQLLHFLYTGNAPNVEDDEMTEPLFIAADKYQVDSLKDWCSSVMSKKLTVENAVRLLALAHLHSADRLQEVCIEFIVKNKAVFWERDDFKTFGKNFFDLFYQVSKLMLSP